MIMTVKKWAEVLTELEDAVENEGEDEKEFFAIYDAIESAIDGKSLTADAEIFLTEEQEKVVESHS